MCAAAATAVAVLCECTSQFRNIAQISQCNLIKKAPSIHDFRKKKLMELMVINFADGKLKKKIEIKAKLNQSNTFNPIKFRMNYGSIMQVNANL